MGRDGAELQGQHRGVGRRHRLGLGRRGGHAGGECGNFPEKCIMLILFLKKFFGRCLVFLN